MENIVKNFKKPKMRDIRALAHVKDDSEKEFLLIANLSRLSVSELEDLSFKEYRVLQEKLNSFL